MTPYGYDQYSLVASYVYAMSFCFHSKSLKSLLGLLLFKAIAYMKIRDEDFTVMKIGKEFGNVRVRKNKSAYFPFF